jgi:hypothetical protein
MNNPHKNARITPLGRAEMVRRIQGGQPLAVVAVGFGISERTARKWLARFQKEEPAGLENRSSRPRTIANRTGEPWLASIERLRRAYRVTGEEIAEKLSMARSTVAGWLARLGLGWLASLESKAPVRRYQRERPGELLHLDIKKLARFEGVGHRITGNRRGRSRVMGYDMPACRHRRRHPACLCRSPAQRKKGVDDWHSCSRAAMVQGARRQGRAGHDGQSLGLCREALPQSLTHPRRSAHPHTALHAQDQWQGRALHQTMLREWA